ncbi:hypothetical protein ACSQ67_015941 [Phaseolus vulgaris]
MELMHVSLLIRRTKLIFTREKTMYGSISLQVLRGDTLVDVVKPILNGWPILRGILPLDNKGVDSHPHTHHEPSYPEQHDEL